MGTTGENPPANRAETKEEPDLAQSDIPNIAMYRPGGYRWFGEEKDGSGCKKEENEDKCKIPLHTKRAKMWEIKKKKEEVLEKDDKETISVESVGESDSSRPISKSDIRRSKSPTRRSESSSRQSKPASRRPRKSTMRIKKEGDCARYVALSSPSGALCDSDDARSGSPPPWIAPGVEAEEAEEERSEPPSI